MLADAHDKLEARLVAAIELQQSTVLQALAGLTESSPLRSGDEGVSRAVWKSAGCASDAISHLPSTGVMDEVAGPRLPNAEENLSREVNNHKSKEPEPPLTESLQVVEHNLRQRRANVVTAVSSKSLKGIDQPHLLRSRIERVRTWAQFVKERREFELTIAAAIVVNAISLGLSADFSVKNPGQDVPTGFRVLDYCFVCIFSAELLLRLASEGTSFFHPKNIMFGWNMFDLVLMCTTIVNEGSFGVNLSVVRVFRIARLVNILRMFRLASAFRELRLIVHGVLNCWKTIICAIILLFSVCYIYAVFCLQVVAEYLAERDADRAVHGERAPGEAKETMDFLSDNFASLSDSIFTLFKALSGGVSWGDVVDPLEPVSVALVLSFPLFIVITVFCVLNIITASFVEAAQRTVMEEDTIALEHIEERQELIKTIRDVFTKHDDDHGGSLDWQEFQSVMGDWRTQEQFTAMGLTLDFQHAKNMFNLFDVDGDGTIDVDEFALGVHHMRGGARSLDMYHEFQVVRRKIDKLLNRLDQGVVQLPQMGDRSSSRVDPLAASSDTCIVEAGWWDDQPAVLKERA